MAYIRKAYGVPVKRGARVEYTGDPKGPRQGCIISANGAWLRIRLDGEKRAFSYHPTWELRILEPEATKP